MELVEESYGEHASKRASKAERKWKKARWTNTTEYEDPYVTDLNQKATEDRKTNEKMDRKGEPRAKLLKFQGRNGQERGT